MSNKTEQLQTRSKEGVLYCAEMWFFTDNSVFMRKVDGGDGKASGEQPPG